MTIPAWVLALLPWAKEKGLPWLRLHWKDACVAAAVLLAFLFWRQSGRLAACEEALSVKADTYQAQSSSATAETTGIIIAKPGPARPCPAQGLCPPCPEFEIHFGAKAGAAAAQSQTAAPSASQAKTIQRRLDFWAASTLQGQVSIGGRVDVVSFGPAIFGAGLESPINNWEPKALVSLGFPLAWPLK